MICPSCKKNNDQGARFCSSCGKKLIKTSPSFFKLMVLGFIITIIAINKEPLFELVNKIAFENQQNQFNSNTSLPLTSSSIESTSQSSCQLSQTVKTAENCVVFIIAQGKNFQSQGSGFLYQEKNLILTNRHVIANASQLFVYDKNKKQYPASLWNYSQNLDLAILKTQENLPFSPCSINLNKIEKGEDIIALGYPATSQTEQINFSDVSYSKGTVSRYAIYQNNYLIEFQATVNPGNSGGPLVNQCGIIGMVTSRSVAPEVKNIAYAISTISINKELPQLLAQKSSTNIAPDFNYISPSYSETPPYSYYEQYNINKESIQKAQKFRETINHLRQVWKTQNTSSFDNNLVEKIKDLLERMANVTENILPKVIAEKPLSSEEIRLLNQLNHMIDLINQYHQQLNVNFDGWDYYYYSCENQLCQKKIGLGKSQCYSSYDCQPKYHYQCVNMTCQSVEGEGEDSCFSNDDCFHYTCQEGRCVKAEGRGNNECYSDYSCYHYQCQDKKCVKINSPGTNQCYSDYFCQ